MNYSNFAERVCRVDWSKYSTSEYYDPETMDYRPENIVRALIELSRYDERDNKSARGLAPQILYAVGNDERGTYYPAALEAIDFLIEIFEHSELKTAQKCAAAVLEDLFYFQLEMPAGNEELCGAVEGQIREMLRPYTEENMAEFWK